MICGGRGGLNSANYGEDEDKLENVKGPPFSFLLLLLFCLKTVLKLWIICYSNYYLC